MRFPLHLTVDSIRHQFSQRLKGHRRFPMVLMLEPLYACNLACLGCSTDRHTGKLEDRLPLGRCLEAVDKCGAPVVSLCGGEPTLYPELEELIAGIIARKHHVYLCTNALLLDSRVYGKIPPHRRLSLNIHLDGMRATHDLVCDRKGVFDRALDMIREGKRLGYHVTTNTTIFKDTDLSEIEEMCNTLTALGVDGILLAPGYHYESVGQGIFMVRREIQEKFRKVLDLSNRFRLSSTPMYLEFAAGMRDYRCSPWSTVTFTSRGWKGPCYLVGRQYFDSWEEFWNGIEWQYWESRRDPACRNCLMHSGFEASAVLGLSRSPRDMLRMAVWNILG